MKKLHRELDNDLNLTNYFNYFTEVEEDFVRLRGRHLLVSPLDWCLIEFWKNQGIPLLVVKRGLERSFEVARQRHKKPPTTLFYCHPAVIEAFEEYQEAMVGSHETSPDAAWTQEVPRDRVVNYLFDLAEGLGGREGESYRRCADQLTSLGFELKSNATLREDEVEKTLVSLASSLAVALMRELPPGRLKELKRHVRLEMKIYKKRLDKDVYLRLEKNYLEKRVREEFNVPELSLYQVDG